MVKKLTVKTKSRTLIKSKGGKKAGVRKSALKGIKR